MSRRKTILTSSSTLGDYNPHMRRTAWAWTLGTFFGVGLPLGGRGMGTVASAVTAAIWWLAAQRLTGSALLAFTAIFCAVAIFAGIPAGTIVAREIGREDPSQVVIDEVAGQLIPLLFAPLRWKYVLAAFILFRAFDVLKPPPARQLEALHGGTGIMLDDVAAGIYALLVCLVLARFGFI
jgi:phosphatidylglycerophosphatase A